MGWQTPDFQIPPERDQQDPREAELAEQARPENWLPCGGRVDAQGYNPITGPYRDAWCDLPARHEGPHRYRYPGDKACPVCGRVITETCPACGEDR